MQYLLRVFSLQKRLAANPSLHKLTWKIINSLVNRFSYTQSNTQMQETLQDNTLANNPVIHGWL